MPVTWRWTLILRLGGDGSEERLEPRIDEANGGGLGRERFQDRQIEDRQLIQRALGLGRFDGARRGRLRWGGAAPGRVLLHPVQQRPQAVDPFVVLSHPAPSSPAPWIAGALSLAMISPQPTSLSMSVLTDTAVVGLTAA